MRKGNLYFWTDHGRAIKYNGPLEVLSARGKVVKYRYPEVIPDLELKLEKERFKELVDCEQLMEASQCQKK